MLNSFLAALRRFLAKYQPVACHGGLFYVIFCKVVGNVPYFLAKCAKIMRGVLQMASRNSEADPLDPPDPADPPETHPAVQNRPWFPTPGGRMTVVNTNSLKL